MEMSDQQHLKGTMYAFATLGARTERGGYVTSATTGLSICNLEVAGVGDVVTYRDGSEAIIIDGSGCLFSSGGKCAALVGSSLSNGDRIAFTPWDDRESGVVVAYGDQPEGLFDPHYVPPPCEPGYRFALRGATTARGGVLLEAGGNWNVNGRLAQIGILGDFVKYADGTTASIVSGLSLVHSGDFVPFAFVGSELDNGDTITDSPERNGVARRDMFEVVKRPTLAREGEAA
jgi:uncharacterized Zn-binding protein involved in type VI secretion